MSSDCVHEYHTQAIAQKLTDYQVRRTQRYTHINVLLLAWEEDDIGSHLDAELNDLDRMFRVEFKYSVQRYRIPSKESELSLNACITQFMLANGGEENLIIVYYSGHGGQTVASRSPCTWAAKNLGGPTLDWSNIQPLLLRASCDVVILLDCCYAGQAARNHISRSVEFLAATDKDQWTPIGIKNHPSFTKILLQKMKHVMDTDGFVTLPALQRQMVDESSGLRRQPFYVSLTGDASAGAIKLVKLGNSTVVSASSGKSSNSLESMSLQLSLFDALDSNTASRLLRWLTKDSPASIEDIQLVTSTLSLAKDANNLGRDLLNTGSPTSSKILPGLGQEGQIAAQQLFSHLRSVLSDPLQEQMSSGDIISVIKRVEKASSDLVTFVADSLTAMDRNLFEKLGRGDSAGFQDLKNRIAMRLTLLDENITKDKIRVDFQDVAEKKQVIRIGKRGKDAVLVEAWAFYTNLSMDLGSALSTASQIIWSGESIGFCLN
ncbi:hypothetical protein QQZ08_000328 [Neonectria magnoliae]|uniref:Uncharacterized protein n=1 Tax=Neonectria magnoliae TaxID=2732573 RepID=A0ABR1IID3_9HYPO